AAYLVVHDSAAAEDIAQEAFLAAVRALDRFDRRRPFGPWLHRIVVNRAIDWARRRELRREVGGDALASEAAPVAGNPAPELAGVLASPPGWALIHSFREAVGIEQAEPELFSLPTGGRLLVSSSSGPWIVQPGGSRRLLGRYRDASWSPHGLYLTVTRENELL